jgi:hypothetical protein
LNCISGYYAKWNGKNPASQSCNHGTCKDFNISELFWVDFYNKLLGLQSSGDQLEESFSVPWDFIGADLTDPTVDSGGDDSDPKPDKDSWRKVVIDFSETKVQISGTTIDKISNCIGSQCEKTYTGLGLEFITGLRMPYRIRQRELYYIGELSSED